MPPQLTRADSLREYLTGAASDGGVQTNAALSLGNFRSATEAVSLGITVGSPLSGVTVLYAGGDNPIGLGTLTAVDANNLTWQPFGTTNPGPPTFFNGVNDTEIVEASGQPGQYLRVKATTPLTLGACTVTLAYIADNVFGMSDVTIAGAAAGVSEYRATVVRNEAVNAVSSFQRWLALLGTPVISNGGGLGGSGSGTITTTSSFADWPTTGWCQVRSTGGTLKEVIYYSSRTNMVLTVPSAGRGLLGTSATAGAITDFVAPTSGVAIGLDPAGVQAFGNSIQTIANVNTPPAGVTWNLGWTAATGLQIGSLGVGQQIGIWLWRQTPAGVVSTSAALTELLDAFNAM